MGAAVVAVPGPPPAKKVRFVVDVPTDWRPSAGPLLDLIGDNATVILWLNGQAACDHPPHVRVVTRAVANIQRIQQGIGAAPAQSGCHWFRHVYRELNDDADAVVNEALDRRVHVQARRPLLMMHGLPDPWRLRAAFDGGRRGASGEAASGYVIFALCRDGTWRLWKKEARYYDPGEHCTVTRAELRAADMLLETLAAVLRDPTRADMR